MTKKFFIIFILTVFLFSLTKVEAASNTRYIDEYGCTIRIRAVNEFESDSIGNQGYLSKTYEIITDNCTLIKYKISSTSDIPEGCLIVNPETNEEQKEFSGEENKFKLMIPANAFFNVEFLGKIYVNSIFQVEIDYMQQDGTIKKQKIEDTNEQYINWNNSKNRLIVNFVDSETQEGIEDVITDICDYNLYNFTRYSSDYEGYIIMENLSSDGVKIRLVKIPEEYASEEMLFEPVLENGWYRCTVNLNRKKGTLHIKSKQKSTYEIIDMEENIIKTYEIDEDGEILDELNTGWYIVRQAELDEEYEKIGDIFLEIIENETLDLEIENEIKVVSNEDEGTNDNEKQEDDKEKQDENELEQEEQNNENIEENQNREGQNEEDAQKDNQDNKEQDEIGIGEHEKQEEQNENIEERQDEKLQEKIEDKEEKISCSNNDEDEMLKEEVQKENGLGIEQEFYQETKQGNVQKIEELPKAEDIEQKEEKIEEDYYLEKTKKETESNVQVEEINNDKVEQVLEDLKKEETTTTKKDNVVTAATLVKIAETEGITTINEENDDVEEVIVEEPEIIVEELEEDIIKLEPEEKIIQENIENSNLEQNTNSDNSSRIFMICIAIFVVLFIISVIRKYKKIRAD